MITVYASSGSEDASVVKAYIKEHKLGKFVKLALLEEGEAQPSFFRKQVVLVGNSGHYSGLQNVKSYLKGYFKL